ncbi:MAG: anti-sigma factor [Solirubrobacterales bacterium]|nr:anti-sigma factor [Solirubrobacterales bacterium]
MSDHDRYEDLQAGYLLGALADDELADFERHLAACDACRAELRWLGPAVDVLAGGVEQREPPARLRARIMGAVEADTPRPATAAPRPALWRRIGLARLATGAAVALALAAGVAGGYALRGDGGDSTTRLATVPVEATSPVVQASGSVVPGEDYWRLDLDDMPELRPGDVYQVWLRRGQSVSPSVLFVPSRDRGARVVLPAANVAGADELLVTREPAGGSREPTSEPLVSATLQ